MSDQASPQPQAVGETISKPTYASCILPQPAEQPLTKIQLKTIDFNHGEPTIKFTLDEIAQYTIEEGLHQALILKFSYGHPDMHQLRKLVPKLLGVKGHCRIGWLASRHILIRFDNYEDYVVAASKVVNYLHCDGEDFLFRVFPWYLGFNPKEETSRAFVWMSLPNLPPELFARRSLLSIASAVGKPIAIDKATQEKSRPSAARVKIEIDLLDKHPNHIRIQYLDVKTGKVMEHIQEYVVDNLPHYCSLCKHQGHEENACRFNWFDNGNNKQISTGNAGKIMEQYQGDAREILNDKRRVNTAASNQTQISGEAVLGNGVQQVTDGNQCNSDMQGQGPNGQNGNIVTFKAGNYGNSQGIEAGLQNNNPGQQQNGVLDRTRGIDKGKKVLIYKEKGNPQLSLNKPTGIRICEPHSSNVIANTETNMFKTVERNVVNNSLTSEVNKVQQKSNDPAGIHGNGDGAPTGSRTTDWTVVTKRKPRRHNLNDGNETNNTDEQTDFFTDLAVAPAVSFSANVAQTVDTAELVNQGDDQLIAGLAITDPVREATAVLSLADEIVRTMEDQIVEKPGQHSFVDAAVSDPTKFSGKHFDNEQNGKNKGSNVTEHAKVMDDTDGQQITMASDIVKQIVVVAADERQNLTEIMGAGESTTMQNNIDKKDNTDAMYQVSEIPEQTDNDDSESHTLDTSSRHNSSNENFGTVHRHQLVDINMMNNVVTGGQHHNSSNWAVLVEEEDDNIGMLELLYKEELEERNQKNPNTDNKALNPNAPDFTPHKTLDRKQIILGKTQQQTVLDLDRELLDALIYVNPLEMKNVNEHKDFYRKSYFDTELFNSDEEDDMSDTFYKKSVMKEGIPPRQQRNEKAKRQLPMRQAKQKGAGPSTSTKSNKSKKNR